MINSNISWTTHTWNPFMGCEKVSEGCKYCYMYKILTNNGKKSIENARNIKITSDNNIEKPLSWKEGSKIFTCSMSDFFIDKADNIRPRLWEIIKKTPQHQYQILTKRPERILESLPSDWSEANYNHVWLGTSIENNNHLDRVDTLKQVKCGIRWLSIEPLLEEVRLTPEILKGIHWVVVGGESGNDFGIYRYRPCELDWIEKIVLDCKTVGVPVFVKQLGTSLAKKYNLKNKKGEDITEWKRDSIIVRQFPR